MQNMKLHLSLQIFKIMVKKKKKKEKKRIAKFMVDTIKGNIFKMARNNNPGWTRQSSQIRLKRICEN